MHELIQMSSLLGRRTKGNLASCFHSIWQIFEKGFLQKISHLGCVHIAQSFVSA